MYIIWALYYNVIIYINTLLFTYIGIGQQHAHARSFIVFSVPANPHSTQRPENPPPSHTLSRAPPSPSFCSATLAAITYIM